MVSVDELLTESEPLLRRAVGEAVSLTLTTGSDGAITSIDPSQFEAAVMNLVVNARDATPQGGGIRVETHPCVLEAGEAEDAPAGDYLCVAVHDTGEGMDAETAARVFEPFFTTKEPGRGTGLGLSQVYGFARQSGGAVTVETAPGKGATVRIYLPRADSGAPRAAASPQAAASPPGPARRHRLVEDVASVGEMVEAMLSDLGHEVLRAEAAAPQLTIPSRRPAALDSIAHRPDHAVVRHKRRGAGSPPRWRYAPRPAGDPHFRLHRRGPWRGARIALAPARQALPRRVPGGGYRRGHGQGAGMVA